jgi:hypothetical protein
MIRLSRNRLVMLAVILLVIALGYYGMGPGVPAMDHRASLEPLRLEQSAQRETAGPERSERSMQGDALAKLRSLLELRKGEIAFVRSSSATMRSLLENPDSPFKDAASEQGITMVGSVSREWIEGPLKERVEREGGVEGVVDSSDDSFGWQSSEFKISGEAIHLEDTVRFNIVAKQGATEVHSISKHPNGSTMLLKLAGPAPEGMVIVVGKK